MDKKEKKMAGGFKYIRKVYKVSYKRGIKVEVNGRPGKIISASHGYIYVRFNPPGKGQPIPCHPTWRIVIKTAAHNNPPDVTRNKPEN